MARSAPKPRPPVEPRGLKAAEAAHYVGFTAAGDAFRAWLEDYGVRPLPRAHFTYDKRALDAAMDKEGRVDTDVSAPPFPGFSEK